MTDVLEQVATGLAREAIVDDWRGDVSKEALAEAVRLVPWRLPVQPLRSGRHERKQRRVAQAHDERVGR